ncbi:hypothetical protein K443DRAFT_674656 [Laccaria amethystina LaAM-08-1]|uniref:Uncharacterized protein n=1 Tax=Laccaria amethystina LaAM-08-1 TaxID=1095629 RepID=A0A0C9X1V1_9AGAR|nr:hypothetical protein K443DRAFT_674656 [Laccaria amethystina LaAM-08-1]
MTNLEGSNVFYSRSPRHKFARRGPMNDLPITQINIRLSNASFKKAGQEIDGMRSRPTLYRGQDSRVRG